MISAHARAARQKKLERLRSGKKPRVLEICSGCGGLALGLLTAGFELSAHIAMDAEAAESYAVNFGRDREAPWALPRDLETCSTEKLVTELGLHTSPEDSF